MISRVIVFFIAACSISATSFAQAAGMKLDSTQPIEIVSDTLDVFQEQSQAVFSGNVIATQGNINMRAAKMVVFYRDTGASSPAETGSEPAAEGSTAMAGEGIYRIEAEGDVFFASPLETAQGQTAIYDVDASTVNLIGNVLLTREGNVLKGTQLVYNLNTGRSTLQGGASASGASGGRVRGLFVPKSNKAGGQ